MAPRDAIQQAAWDRRRIKKEDSAAALHEITYNIDDWKASTKFAFPRERIAYSNVPELLPALGHMQPPSRGGDSLLPYPGVSAGAWQSRPQSTMPSSRLRLSLPMQQTAARASKVLNSITPADWSSFTKDGAPEAWQVARRMKGTKKGNLNLRKELAHITHLRDIHRRAGAHSTEPSSSYPTTQGLEGGDMGNGGAQRGTGTPVQYVPGRSSGHQNKGSRNGTPANMPPRPATSISNLGEFLPPASRGGTPAMTPNTWKHTHLLELLGTESRPTTVYKVLKRRQPQAEMHMLWSAGPKKFDAYQKNMEDELIAEKKAETAKRKLLTKLLRQKMQTACTNTKTLPRDLWDKFKTADGDGSGRLEFDEYCQVMGGVGLGANELGMQGLKTLYRIADKDGNGNIDFNEFLVAVVGNLVSI